MYKFLIRPLLFLLNPERVHHLLVQFLSAVFRFPGIYLLISRIFTVKHHSLEREFLGLHFSSPVGLAAGFDKDAKLIHPLSAFGFGFIEIGTVTPEPQPGNPKPRLFRVKQDEALINRMGFNNLGVEQVINNLRYLKRSNDIIIGGNIGKNTSTPNNKAAKDYLTCFRKLYNYVDYFVANVSCPNISDIRELQEKDLLLEILENLLKEREGKDKKKPVLLKISPDLNYSQLDDVIDIYFTSGIDGLVVTNTTITRYDLTISPTKIDKIGNGGLSGSPLRKRSTEVIQYIHQKSLGKIPMIGVGGIMSPRDALDKLEAGATLIQVYTGFIYEGPAFMKRINKRIIKEYQ